MLFQIVLAKHHAYGRVDKRGASAPDRAPV